MAIRLTDEQVLAAASDAALVNIVSGPGFGKTTVSAARFGYLHHRDPADLLMIRSTGLFAGLDAQSPEWRNLPGFVICASTCATCSMVASSRALLGTGARLHESTHDRIPQP